MNAMIGTLLGAAVGFAYAKLFRCSGQVACPITRHPWLTMIAGAVVGFMFALRSP